MVKLLSQRNLAWGLIQLGTCRSETISSAGCIITSLAMMLDSTPDIINERAIYIRGCLVSWKATAQALGMQYSAIRNRPVVYPCIAEVKVPKGQHFVVVDGEKQYDPWTGKEGNYKILSYRNISPVSASSITREEVIELYRAIKQTPTEENIRNHMKAPNRRILYSGFFSAYRNDIIKEAEEQINKMR